ncbi:FimB/Mfa2 family fimbrial subunit [Bacteroides neonati]|uniref:FimB/Mfa2 family fimbrial subunit n=1 Tax=Bacteroides neonati TaxID=1347393 RepID=UPI0004B8263F|nr:FimB/Mfa2 family fimbrial subunit [Bacteroides neonati]
MNLKNKILITIMFALGTILWSCDSLINDKLEDCPQGVYVKFYSMTPCENDSSFIGEAASVWVFAFDENNKLAAAVSEANVTLSRDYELLVPVSNGNYTFVAWAGINDNFVKQRFVIGEMTKKDVMITLNSSQGMAAVLSAANQLWQGESPMVHLPNPAEVGTLYKHTAINMKELTNRINVLIEFDKLTMKEYTPENLKVEISSANGTLNVDGSMPYNTPVLTYPSLKTEFTDHSGSWSFSMLDLVTGHHNNLKVTYQTKDKVETVFDGDLIAALLLKAVAGGVNMNCENDFTIKFVIKDYCVECWTHFSCMIYVNNWMVHSYDTDL